MAKRSAKSKQSVPNVGEERIKSPTMVAAGIQAAITRRAQNATRASQYSHDWAVTMTKWLITKTNRGVKWQIVEFLGPNGGESKGIVDLMAIRKDHNRTTVGVKRGDFFEIVLIQVKGGSASARRPTNADIVRLRQVAKEHGVTTIVLAEWIKGTQPCFYSLSVPTGTMVDPSEVWVELPAGILVDPSVSPV